MAFKDWFDIQSEDPNAFEKGIVMNELVHEVADSARDVDVAKRVQAANKGTFTQEGVEAEASAPVAE